MSAVLLGMEMPRGCEHCQLADPAWIGFCRIEKRFWNPDPGQPLRPGWCPLRPLPEKHGRLIDADALYDSLGVSDEDICFKYMLEECQTIVEAEGE